MQKGRKIGSLPGLIFWVTALFCDVFFLVRYGREYMDSDIAAEIILSSLKQTGPVFFINSNWYYSTELRVLNLQPLYKIGLLLSPDRSYIARAIGMAIAFLLVSAAVWLFCRACDLGSYAEWMAAFTLCPVSFWYQYQTIFGGQYLTYIIISFWALLALVKVSRSKNKTKMYCWGALLMVIAFLTGMQGVRQGMILFVPLIPVALWLRKEDKRFVYATLFSLLIYMVGVLLNISVLGEYYWFAPEEQQTFGTGTGSFITGIRWFLESYGYCQSSELGYFRRAQIVNILGLEGILVGFGIIMGAVMLASMIFDIKYFRKFSEWEKMIVALVFSMIAVMLFVFAFMKGDRQYWQQTIPFGYFLVIIAFKNSPLVGKPKGKYVPIIIAVLVTGCSVGTTMHFVKEAFAAEPGVSKVIDYILEETDYRVGYASFWLADTTQVMSEGRIEMYDAEEVPHSLELHQWLQRMDHEETAPQSHYFLLLYSQDEDWQNDPDLISMGAERIYDDGMYCVYTVD